MKNSFAAQLFASSSCSLGFDIGLRWWVGSDGFLDLVGFFFFGFLLGSFHLLWIFVGFFFFVGLWCWLPWWVGGDVFDLGFLADGLIEYCDRIIKFVMGYN